MKIAREMTEYTEMLMALSRQTKQIGRGVNIPYIENTVAACHELGEKAGISKKCVEQDVKVALMSPTGHVNPKTSKMILEKI